MAFGRSTCGRHRPGKLNSEPLGTVYCKLTQCKLGWQTGCCVENPTDWGCVKLSHLVVEEYQMFKYQMFVFFPHCGS